MGNEWLKKTFMLFFFFFPLEVIFSDIKMRLWWVHSCSALLLLWMREVFYSKAAGQVPGFKPHVCWKAPLSPGASCFGLRLTFWTNASSLLPFTCLVSSNRSHAKYLPSLEMQKSLQKKNWNILEKRIPYGMETHCGNLHGTGTV